MFSTADGALWYANGLFLHFILQPISKRFYFPAPYVSIARRVNVIALPDSASAISGLLRHPSFFCFHMANTNQ